jgi:hypothetical protein
MAVDSSRGSGTDRSLDKPITADIDLLGEEAVEVIGPDTFSPRKSQIDAPAYRNRLELAGGPGQPVFEEPVITFPRTGRRPRLQDADVARSGKNTPELASNWTVRLLQRVTELPGLSLALALLLVEYHIHRNEVGRRFHTKTRMARQMKVKLLPL